ncbi:hypothetical protein PR048_010553 [Dryococelus australis]|uniref:Uncharacterized protein n=1 Tax=Dryococelus australis TaxID=614101 RepID=A0ABQ9I322_9NEOP|nr:hypothetical protein PR048_010553 [Dryococelus australis]
MPKFCSRIDSTGFGALFLADQLLDRIHPGVAYKLRPNWKRKSNGDSLTRRQPKQGHGIEHLNKNKQKRKIGAAVMYSPPTTATGIVPDDAAGRRVFSGISHFPRPSIPALLRIALPWERQSPHWCYFVDLYNTDHDFTYSATSCQTQIRSKSPISTTARTPVLLVAVLELTIVLLVQATPDTAEYFTAFIIGRSSTYGEPSYYLPNQMSFIFDIKILDIDCIDTHSIQGVDSSCTTTVPVANDPTTWLQQRANNGPALRNPRSNRKREPAGKWKYSRGRLRRSGATSTRYIEKGSQPTKTGYRGWRLDEKAVGGHNQQGKQTISHTAGCNERHEGGWFGGGGGGEGPALADVHVEGSQLRASHSLLFASGGGIAWTQNFRKVCNNRNWTILTLRHHTVCERSPNNGFNLFRWEAAKLQLEKSLSELIKDREEGIGEEMRRNRPWSFVRDPAQHSPGVISEDRGKKPKSGWPGRESNPGPPGCEYSELPPRRVRVQRVTTAPHRSRTSAVRGNVVRGNVVRGNAVRGNVVRGNVVRGNVVRGNVLVSRLLPALTLATKRQLFLTNWEQSRGRGMVSRHQGQCDIALLKAVWYGYCLHNPPACYAGSPRAEEVINARPARVYLPPPPLFVHRDRPETRQIFAEGKLPFEKLLGVLNTWVTGSPPDPLPNHRPADGPGESRNSIDNVFLAGANPADSISTGKCTSPRDTKRRNRSKGDISIQNYFRGHIYALGTEMALVTSHQGEPGSIPGGITPGSSHVAIMPEVAASPRVFSGISQFPRQCIPGRGTKKKGGGKFSKVCGGENYWAVLVAGGQKAVAKHPLFPAASNEHARDTRQIFTRVTSGGKTRPACRRVSPPSRPDGTPDYFAIKFKRDECRRMHAMSLTPWLIDVLRKGHIRTNLQTEQGKELHNAKFKALMKKHYINHYSTFSNLKASIYNYTVHSTTRMKPEYAKDNSLFRTLYTALKIRDRRKPKSQVGDLVCISKQKGIFKKGFTANWCPEFFCLLFFFLPAPIPGMLKQTSSHRFNIKVKITDFQHDGQYGRWPIRMTEHEQLRRSTPAADASLSFTGGKRDMFTGFRIVSGTHGSREACRECNMRSCQCIRILTSVTLLPPPSTNQSMRADRLPMRSANKQSNRWGIERKKKRKKTRRAAHFDDALFRSVDGRTRLAKSTVDADKSISESLITNRQPQSRLAHPDRSRGVLFTHGHADLLRCFELSSGQKHVRRKGPNTETKGFVQRRGGGSPRKPATNQRHRPARSSRAIIRERPRRESNPERLGGRFDSKSVKKPRIDYGRFIRERRASGTVGHLLGGVISGLSWSQSAENTEPSVSLLYMYVFCGTTRSAPVRDCGEAAEGGSFQRYVLISLPRHLHFICLIRLYRGNRRQLYGAALCAIPFSHLPCTSGRRSRFAPANIAFEAEKRGSDKGDTDTLIKCAIATMCKALNWRALFSSHYATSVVSSSGRTVTKFPEEPALVSPNLPSRWPIPIERLYLERYFLAKLLQPPQSKSSALLIFRVHREICNFDTAMLSERKKKLHYLHTHTYTNYSRLCLSCPLNLSMAVYPLSTFLPQCAWAVLDLVLGDARKPCSLLPAHVNAVSTDRARPISWRRPVCRCERKEVKTPTDPKCALITAFPARCVYYFSLHSRGRGGEVIGLLVLGTRVRFPAGVATRISSGISCFPRPVIPALLHARLTSPSSAFKTSIRPNYSTHGLVVGVRGVRSAFRTRRGLTVSGGAEEGRRDKSIRRSCNKGRSEQTGLAHRRRRGQSAMCACERACIERGEDRIHGRENKEREGTPGAAKQKETA